MSFLSSSSAHNKSCDSFYSSSSRKTIESLKLELEEKKRDIESSQSVLFRCKETILSLTTENKNLHRHKQLESNQNTRTSDFDELSVLKEALINEKEKNRKLLEVVELKDQENYNLNNRLDELNDIVLLRNQEINDLRKKTNFSIPRKGFWGSFSLNHSAIEIDDKDHSDISIDLENQLTLSHDTLVPEWNANSQFIDLGDSDESEMKIEGKYRDNKSTKKFLQQVSDEKMKQSNKLRSELSATNDLVSMSLEMNKLHKAMTDNNTKHKQEVSSLKKELSLLQKQLVDRNKEIKNLAREAYSNNKSYVLDLKKLNDQIDYLKEEVEEKSKSLELSSRRVADFNKSLFSKTEQIKQQSDQIRDLKKVIQENSEKAQLIINNLSRTFSKNSMNHNSESDDETVSSINSSGNNSEERRSLLLEVTNLRDQIEIQNNLHKRECETLRQAMRQTIKQNQNQNHGLDQFVNSSLLKMRLLQEIRSNTPVPPPPLSVEISSDINSDNIEMKVDNDEFHNNLNKLDTTDSSLLKKSLQKLSSQLSDLTTKKSLEEQLQSIDCRMIVTDKQRYLIVRQR